MKAPEFKILIVDDEPDARGIVAHILKEQFPRLNIVGEAENIDDALYHISLYKPHFLFLDVEMPGGSGFDLLARLTELPPVIIFITAYDKYAIRAIKAAAHDYILKPVREEELKLSVNKGLGKLTGLTAYPPAMKPEPISQNPEVPRIAIPNLHGLRFAEVDQIIRCEADGNYTIIYFSDGSKEVVSRNLSRLEKDLSGCGFLRVHHKHLVNLKMIRSYSRGKGGGYLIMPDKAIVGVSARKKSELLRSFISAT